jgi:hypothetical protein
MYFESASLDRISGGERGEGRLWRFGYTMSNSQIFAKGGRSSHTNHANLFRNSSLFNVAHTGPAMTGQALGIFRLQ